MKFKLPAEVLFIIDRLEAHGYRADVVGGPVRDFLLGKTPSDYDITTSALPEQTKVAFADKRTVDTGIKHGTVSLVLDGGQYEITTYRIDGEYKDARHPETVYFTKELESDLARRDFTMNAIAYSPTRGITDVFGGREDISAGIIRTVGEPQLRFSEDALRILRGVRFAARLGFEVEEGTRLAMLNGRHTLRLVSAERIFVELKKLLEGDFAYSVLASYSEIILVVLPELFRLSLPDESAFLSAEPYTRLLSLFALSSENPSAAFATAMRRLKSDNETRLVGEAVLSEIGKRRLGSLSEAAELLSLLGERGAKIFVDLENLLGRFGEREKDLLARAINDKIPYKIAHLDVTGNDLLALGLCGKEIGIALAELLGLVISGELKNERGALLAYLTQKRM